MFQPRIVEKAKKNRQIATNIGPILSPKADAKAVCARFVLSMPLGITPPAIAPSSVYMVEITTSALSVRMTNVSTNTPIIATVPCS